MSNVNSCTVSGNLTADPEVVADGKITKLRLAVNRTRKVEEEYVEEASFFDVNVFGNFAALVARKLRKGNAATVQGRLEEQRWEDKETGANRSKVVIVAFEIDSPAFFVKDEDIPASESEPAAAVAGSSQGDDIPF